MIKNNRIKKLMLEKLFVNYNKHNNTTVYKINA